MLFFFLISQWTLFFVFKEINAQKQRTRNHYVSIQFNQLGFSQKKKKVTNLGPNKATLREDEKYPRRME